MRAAIVVASILFALSGCSLSITEQAKRLGTKPFTEQAWAAANKQERGEMVWSFLSQYDVKTFTFVSIRKILGNPTAYAGSDGDSAYAVGPDTVSNDWGKGYLLVFVGDRATGQIVDVEISPEVE
jgi:hypothetical protein